MKWIEFHRPAEVTVENVIGFKNWGPVDPRSGRPLKEFRGRFFESWIRNIREAGYTLEWEELDCADFGAITSRPRLIIRARLGRRAPAWPTATHSTNRRAAREAIDLCHSGRSFDGRVSDNTLRRIAIGRERFGECFLIEYYGSSSAVSLDRPLPTITTRDRHGLVCRTKNYQRLRGFRIGFGSAERGLKSRSRSATAFPPCWPWQSAGRSKDTDHD